MSGKSVRFQDLSFIQESEEDQPEEVVQLTVPSPAQTGGAPGSSITKSSQEVKDGTSTEPPRASCPFGERIAQERAEKERLDQQSLQHEQKDNDRDDSEELPFPRNVIRIQEQEKSKLAKKKTSAGINPSAGKEKGTSFIITRNYLCGVTDNSISLQPRSVLTKAIQDTAQEVNEPGQISLPISCAVSTTPLNCLGLPRTDIPGTNGPTCFHDGVSDIKTVPEVLPFSLESELACPGLGLDSQNCYLNDISTQLSNSIGIYKPDPNLTKFINPHTAPSVQFYGSATYGLKSTPQDTLSKPDIIASSSVNQYLHHSRDYSTDSRGPYFSVVRDPRPLTSQSTVCASASHAQSESKNSDLKPPTPKLQFLRDNFSEADCIQLTSSTTKNSAHTDKTETHISSYDGGQPSTSYPSVPLIGPIVVSPRKLILPSKSSPGPLIDNKQSTPSVSAASVTSTTAAAAINNTMNYMGNTADIYSHPAPLSRFQEKEELQQLNDRFTSYVNRVRQLGQHVNNVDTSAFLRSTKVLEDEIVSLKKMYEAELASLRQEIETGCHERNSIHVQCNKHQKYAGEVQDRLAIETDKNAKLLDEINILQRKLGNLEAEIQDTRIASQRPREEMDQLHRTIENLTRESDQWKHRYDHEQVARQEAEDRVQQFMKKMEFADQVNQQQISDYQTRLDTASATILSLEGKVRELSTADISVAEMLKQVRDKAETELKKYQLESEEQYSRNLSALKAQIDNDADNLSRYQTEKSQLMGNIGELHARIRNLEGQVSNMQHQKQSLEDAIGVERNRSADNIQHLEKKLREVQDMLVEKMREITNAREANLPLKAEIETLKALLAEEERRLRVPIGIVSASVVQTSLPPTPSTKDILTSSITNQVLKPRSPPDHVAALSARPTSVGFISNQQPCVSSVANLTQSQAVKNVSIAPASTTQLMCTGDVVAQSSSSPSSALPAAVTTAASTYHTAATTNLATATYCYPPSLPIGSGMPNSLYPYAPSPPLDTLYIPDSLQTYDDAGTLAYDADYGCGDGGYYDPNAPGFALPMSGPRYCYEANPSVNRLSVAPSPPLSPNSGANVRAKSAPASKTNAPMHTSAATQIAAARERNLNLIPSDMGNGRDYFDEMFNDLQRDTLFAKARPKSSPLERPVPSTYHDYTVSTSSAIGDLKILEVNQEGKFVRLVNDGPTEFEFGGYMIQQNVGGHPVAVFRFPPRTKFPPDSTITIWSAMTDPLVHNPPTDFYWKEQQKWGTGPECTTILCRANGQAVAWTTAAHRFTKDAFMENRADGDDSNKFDYDKEKDDDDEEVLRELTMDSNVPRPEPVYLRREKQQPPTLTASKHPHGASPTNISHPHTGQPRPFKCGNDNSSVNRQSRTQSTRPDPVPGQPYAGAPAQRVGSAPLRKMGNQGSQGTIRTNGSLANRSEMEPGETTECPSPFMRPHTRYETGLEQVQSQHHSNFLPPMPRPPQASY